MCLAPHRRKMTLCGGWIAVIALVVSLPVLAVETGALADAAMNGNLAVMQALLKGGAKQPSGRTHLEQG